MNFRQKFCLWRVKEEISLKDYIINPYAIKYAVAFDRLGKLGWKENVIKDELECYNDTPIIEVLTENDINSLMDFIKLIKPLSNYFDNISYLDIHHVSKIDKISDYSKQMCNLLHFYLKKIIPLYSPTISQTTSTVSEKERSPGVISSDDADMDDASVFE